MTLAGTGLAQMNGGTMYCSTQAVGTVREYPITGSPIISNLELDPSGLAWFTCEGGTNRIGTFDYRTGTINLYVLGAAGNNFGGLHLGPDVNGVPNNAIWVGNSSTNTVQIIDLATSALANGSSAVIQATYNAPTQPGGICADADSLHMWVCYGQTSQMGILSYSGGAFVADTPINTITASAGVHGNHLGPDGRVWVCLAAAGVNKVAAFTRAPSVVEYPGVTGRPYWINVGPNNGMMYGTEETGGKVFSCTMGGFIQEKLLTVSTGANVFCGGIWPTPAGDMMFTIKTDATGASTNRVGRWVLSSNTIIEYPNLTAGANPDKIIALPNGLMLGTEHDLGILFTIQP